MRFLAEGPSIPDELLVARDEGRVVFFCGAGVSRARVGLSDFLELTTAVADKLAITPHSPTRKLIEAIRTFPQIAGIGSLISADRVFGLIEREFLPADIYAAIATSLKPTGSLDLSAHRTLLDLAKGPDGKVRLVTTNFDLLFEACDPGLVSYKPPRLPNPLRDDEFFGVIHLHGHVTDDYGGAAGDGFVISSGEFGRAYLSERWATDFIRTVLQRFVVVFVGYAADDPPMQYLLEALNRTAGSLSGVYAFQSGSIEDAQARWVQKGVQPIAYDASSNHDLLWQTLEAWADRARDPDAWHSRLIASAHNGPEPLQPHERGQIAHIVSTLEGARKFSQATELPPASWLCSFDPFIRYARPSDRSTTLKRGHYFDPFDAFGLDSDLVPAKISPTDSFAKREIPPGAWDGFALTRQDRQNLREDQFAALRGHWSRNVPALVTRLALIANWISKVSGQPAAAWWAARQVGLHPDGQQQIKFAIESNTPPFSTEVRRAWRYLFDAWSVQRNETYRDWFELSAYIKADGWSDITVRELAAIQQPYLKTGAAYFGAARPPDFGSAPQLSELVHVDVEYPDIHREIEIPDEYLQQFVRELRKNLELAVLLENEIGGYGLSNVPPIEADAPPDHPHGISKEVLEFVKLFKRLLDLNEDDARREAKYWSDNDDPIFTRLSIWACGDERITSVAEAGRYLRKLSQRAFWDSFNQRDLLLVLAKRWDRFSKSTKRGLERRLLKGRSRWKNEKTKDFKDRRASQTLTRISWLLSQGCQFGFDVAAETERLRTETSDWKPEWASHAVDSLESRTGWVRTDTESSALAQVPLANLLTKAKELSGRNHELFVEHDPYAGLCKERPARALAALTVAGRRGEYPTWAWDTFLNAEARKGDKPRMSVIVAERLARLPDGVLASLAYPASNWLLKVSTQLFAEGHDAFERVWAALITMLKAEQKHGASAIIQRSGEHDWTTEALNSPVGHMAQALLNDPTIGALTKETGLPGPWSGHADELLSLVGDPRRHALAMFSHHLVWLYHIDPAWAEGALLSAINQSDEDAAAFWGGFFWGARTPQESLYAKIKPALLRLAHKRSFARRQHAETLAGVILVGWGNRVSTTGDRAISNEEMRAILIDADDDFRSQIIWQLDAWSQDYTSIWPRETLVMLKEVWPRQIAAKTSAVSARLSELAFSHDNDFPEYVDAILPLVIAVNQDHMRLPMLRKSDKNVIDRFPEKALELLNAILPEDARSWPYGINDILGRIGDAAPPLLNDVRLVQLNRIWNAR